MQKLRINYKVLISIYVCVIILLGIGLLLNSKFQIHHSASNGLPLDFLLHFSIFWFASFMLALLFFVVHVRMHFYSLSNIEIAQSTLIGAFVFIIGICITTLAGVFLYTFT